MKEDINYMNNKEKKRLEEEIIGYNTKEIVVNEPSQKLKIKLSSNEVALKAIEVSDIRISEKQKQSALTVEA